MLRQKHGSDDVVDSPAKCPTGAAARQLSSSPTSSGGGAAGGRNVGGKTTASPVVPDVISEANKLKVGWEFDRWARKELPNEDRFNHCYLRQRNVIPPLSLSVCLSVSLSLCARVSSISQEVIDWFSAKFCGVIDVRPRTTRLDLILGLDPGCIFHLFNMETLGVFRC